MTGKIASRPWLSPRGCIVSTEGQAHWVRNGRIRMIFLKVQSDFVNSTPPSPPVKVIRWQLRCQSLSPPPTLVWLHPPTSMDTDLALKMDSGFRSSNTLCSLLSQGLVHIFPLSGTLLSSRKPPLFSALGRCPCLSPVMQSACHLHWVALAWLCLSCFVRLPDYHLSLLLNCGTLRFVHCCFSGPSTVPET